MESCAVSVLVLSFNTRDLTLACLGALAAESPKHAREILVLDNASTDGSADAIAERFPGVRLVRGAENLGYAQGNNRLAAEARGRYLCLLGSDTEPRAGAIDALVDYLDESPSYAAAAPRLENPDGSLQKACMRWPTLAVALIYDMKWRRWPVLGRIDDRYYYRDFDHEHDRDVDQPPGTCFVVRRSVWEGFSGMDPQLWLYFNDVDFCKRTWEHGHRIRYLSGPRVTHHLGASTRTFGPALERWAKDRIAYYHKHYGWVGRATIRVMLRLRAWQEWWDLGRRHADPKHRRDARADLKRTLRRVLS